MTIQQFLLILRARYKVALLALLITVAVAAVLTALMPRRYTATAAVLVDVKSPDSLTGVVLPGMVAPGYMATQVDVITSDRVAQRVVTLLGMDKDPTIRSQWVEETGGKGSFINYLADSIGRNLDVRPARESNVITIDYKTSDPEFAAVAANAFAKAYVDINLDLKVEPARQYAEWFQGQTQVSRDKLNKAQRALYEYQQKVGIVATDERLDFETTKLNESASQLTAIQTMTTDAQSKRGAGDTVQEVMQSPLVNSLKTEIARVQAKLQESSGNLGAEHPQTKRTEAELASLKQQLNTETARITASINTAYQVGKQRERELQAAIAAQKDRVLEINNHRNELNVLKGDVDAAQREFEAISQRAAQSRLESLSNQTNLSVLTVASPPLKPSSPRVLLNMLASVFVGTLLGICIALFIELTNRRVRSTDDLADFLELPVLASIASSSMSRAQRKLSNKSSMPALGHRSAA
ncbi:chain length determinant protein EpsF [Xylophilus rhododendri]|uniref:Chain length determinant protein EpsF n=1 Tax=Xylophilus rhododendri TaxID=2697032 RepID=A0A857JAH4_9BURK|nr:chain length determinant protein EpsF [Xylophilus rhododendri]QHI99982.1 chain length determinant protein EpsF [Xylophilus rhododendri]